MKVKTLIKKLQALDPEGIVTVQEYNGWEDACRPVTKVGGLANMQALSEAFKKKPRDTKTPIYLIRGLE
jgi:hypothetical protein